MVRAVSVVVVGGGVCGVGSALAILRHHPECNVTILAEDITPNTTGDGAAGLWEPYNVYKTPQEKIIRWSQGTWNLFSEWYKKGDNKTYGLQLVHTTFLHGEPTPLPFWHHIPLHYSTLTDKEMAEYGPKYKHGSKMTTFTAEPKTFLKTLMDEVKTRGGHIMGTGHRLTSLQEAASLTHTDIIINCSGIGARDLTPDPTVFPGRGQVMRVKAPWITNGLIDDTSKAYILPNQDTVVLGGTLQENNWNLEVDENDSKSILKKCAALVPSLESAEVVKEWVGLRPCRRGGVRLERDEIQVGNRKVPVIHNYGHGGAGVTLFWGCAQEVADITSRIIKQHYQTAVNKL